MKLLGAQILLKGLEKQGVKIIFGYPGGSVIPIFDELYKAKKPKFILVRHEQGATHMADGYARATGDVGVVLVTSGPGATNTVTGIATAYADSIPMIIITGQVATNLIGNDAFQEADICGITRPIVKHNFLVKKISDLPMIIEKAFFIARTGRPGPVLIDLPVDVSKAEMEFENFPEKIEIKGYQTRPKVILRQVEEAVKMIKNSKKPLLYAGGGIIISGASAEFTALARTLKIPVATTLMGLGCFPETDKLSLGMLGMHGTKPANFAIQNCDLLISVGARFDDRVTGKIGEFAPYAKIIHIDIDPSSISKNVKVDIDVVGDAKEIIKELLKAAEPLNIPNWLRKVSGWKKQYPLNYDREKNIIKPQFVIEAIDRLKGDNAIITTEVGQHQMFAAQYLTHAHPRNFLSSGGLGTMGFGFPAAIGAQSAFPDKLVIDIAGDGSFKMNIQELETCVIYGLPVKVIILNNGYLGMVRQWQEMFFGKRYSATNLQPDGVGEIFDFVKIAEGYGVKGFRVSEKCLLEKTLKEAFAHQGPVVVDVRTEREENVFPMIPPGKAVHEMVG